MLSPNFWMDSYNPSVSPFAAIKFDPDGVRFLVIPNLMVMAVHDLACHFPGRPTERCANVFGVHAKSDLVHEGWLSCKSETAADNDKGHGECACAHLGTPQCAILDHFQFKMAICGPSFTSGSSSSRLPEYFFTFFWSSRNSSAGRSSSNTLVP